MTVYKAGDIVLLHFPFTDLSTVKKRPAVILSPDDFSTCYQDVVVMALTSKDQGDDSLRVSDWRSAGLVKATWIKPLIGTLAADLVEKKLGELSVGDNNNISAILKRMIAGKYLTK